MPIWPKTILTEGSRAATIDASASIRNYRPFDSIPPGQMKLNPLPFVERGRRFLAHIPEASPEIEQGRERLAECEVADSEGREKYADWRLSLRLHGKHPLIDPSGHAATQALPVFEVDAADRRLSV